MPEDFGKYRAQAEKIVHYRKLGNLLTKAIENVSQLECKYKGISTKYEGANLFEFLLEKPEDGKGWAESNYIIDIAKVKQKTLELYQMIIDGENGLKDKLDEIEINKRNSRHMKNFISVFEPRPYNEEEIERILEKYKQPLEDFFVTTVTGWGKDRKGKGLSLEISKKALEDYKKYLSTIKEKEGEKALSVMYVELCAEKERIDRTLKKLKGGQKKQARRVWGLLNLLSAEVQKAHPLKE